MIHEGRDPVEICGKGSLVSKTRPAKTQAAGTKVANGKKTSIA
jgi:hypothetical protein